jgi:hypothetical protein
MGDDLLRLTQVDAGDDLVPVEPVRQRLAHRLALEELLAAAQEVPGDVRVCGHEIRRALQPVRQAQALHVGRLHVGSARRGSATPLLALTLSKLS